MTEKRFTNIEILDNVLYIRVDGETRIISENKLEEVLNALHEENQRLKQAIDMADDLIKSHLSRHYNRKWENYCSNIGVDLE